MDKVKEYYHYDEAKTIGDEIIGVAEKGKGIVDDLRNIREGKIKTFDPIKVTIKTGDKIEGSIVKKGSMGSAIKANMTLHHADALMKKANIVYDIYDSGEKLKTVSDEIKKLTKSNKQIEEEYDKCMEKAGNMKSKNFGTQDRCISISMKQKMNALINLVADGTGNSSFKDELKDIGGIK